MVSEIIKNHAVFYVSLMSIYWQSAVSLALGWLLKFCCAHIHVSTIQMKKSKYFGLGDPKDSKIMPAGQYPHSESLNNEVPIDPNNQNSVHSIQTWDLDRIFHTLDRNGDGMVEVDNIQGLLEKLGLHYFCDDNMKIMMDFPEQMNFDDFCRHFGSLWEGAQSAEIMEEEIQKGELREAFSVFDKDGDGFITPSELQEVLLSLGLKEGQELENCVTMITRFDKDFDGRIDPMEFENMMTIVNKSS